MCNEAENSRFYEFSNEIYLLKTGVRDCCLIEEVSDEDIKLITDLVLEDGYRIKINKTFDPKYRPDVYVYKYDYQDKLINLIIEAYNSGKATDFLIQYSLGKLLGYSDQSMDEYFKRLDTV